MENILDFFVDKKNSLIRMLINCWMSNRGNGQMGE